MVGTLADDMETDDASGVGGVNGIDETTTIKKKEEEEEEQQEEEKVDHKVQLRKLSRAYEVAKVVHDSSRQGAAESIAKEILIRIYYSKCL